MTIPRKPKRKSEENNVIRKNDPQNEHYSAHFKTQNNSFFILNVQKVFSMTNWLNIKWNLI